MADSVFNVAKGRVKELVTRVDNNDPTNSAIVVVALVATATHATMIDYDTLAALLGDANVAEATNSGYSRIVLTDADISVSAPDDTNNRQDAEFPELDFGTPASGDVWTHLAFCYDSDTTGGTDANIVPLTVHDYALTPDGSAITVPTGDFYRAS